MDKKIFSSLYSKIVFIYSCFLSLQLTVLARILYRVLFSVKSKPSVSQIFENSSLTSHACHQRPSKSISQCLAKTIGFQSMDHSKQKLLTHFHLNHFKKRRVPVLQWS